MRPGAVHVPTIKWCFMAAVAVLENDRAEKGEFKANARAIAGRIIQIIQKTTMLFQRSCGESVAPA